MTWKSGAALFAQIDLGSEAQHVPFGFGLRDSLDSKIVLLPKSQVRCHFHIRNAHASVFVHCCLWEC